MSGCHYVGNVAFSNNYLGTHGGSLGTACSCPCHGPYWSVTPPQCWCHCRKNTQVYQFTDVLMTEKVKLLEQQISDLQKRLEPIEQWKKTAKILCDQSKKPHKCPVCDGKGKIYIDPSRQLSGIEAMFAKKDVNGLSFEDCRPCEAKGILWG